MGSTLDAFAAQIVNHVRRMPDEAILALVLDQLGLGKRGLARASRSTAARSSRSGKTASPASAKVRTVRRRGPRATPEARQKLLELVERTVKAAKGLSTSEIAKRIGVPMLRAQGAVRELKAAKRIYQGGDRRFARYAGDPQTARQASLHARQNASGTRGKR